MIGQLNAIEQEALAALRAIEAKDALENWRVAYLGKKSPLMTILGETACATLAGSAIDTTLKTSATTTRRLNNVRFIMAECPFTSRMIEFSHRLTVFTSG